MQNKVIPMVGRGVKKARSIMRDGERGAALVEMALTVPIFMILVLGMTGFGIVFNQYLQLTEAVNMGGEQLALARGNDSDPCATVATAVQQVASLLQSSNMTFSFTLNGTSYPFTKGASPSCTGGSTTLTNAGPGAPVTLQVTYSCSGTTAFTLGLVKFNPLPASSCNLISSITELSQ